MVALEQCTTELLNYTIGLCVPIVLILRVIMALVISVLRVLWLYNGCCVLVVH